MGEKSPESEPEHTAKTAHLQKQGNLVVQSGHGPALFLLIPGQAEQSLSSSELVLIYLGGVEIFQCVCQSLSYSQSKTSSLSVEVIKILISN